VVYFCKYPAVPAWVAILLYVPRAHDLVGTYGVHTCSIKYQTYN